MPRVRLHEATLATSVSHSTSRVPWQGLGVHLWQVAQDVLVQCSEPLERISGRMLQV